MDLEEDSVMNERRGAALLGIALEVLWVVLIGATGCGGGGGGAALPGDDPSKLTIRLRSSAFPEGGSARSRFPINRSFETPFVRTDP